MALSGGGHGAWGMGHGAWGMGHGAWEASGGPLPLLGGLKTNISAELSFLKSKLSPTFTRGAPPPLLKIPDPPLFITFGNSRSVCL